MAEQSINRPEQQAEKPQAGDSAVAAQGADLSRAGANADYNAMKARGTSTAESHLPQGFGIDFNAGNKPGEQTTKPGEQTTKPGEQTTKPGEQTTKPGEQTTKPGEQTTKPGEQPSKPGEQPAKVIADNSGDPGERPSHAVGDNTDNPKPPEGTTHHPDGTATDVFYNRDGGWEVITRDKDSSPTEATNYGANGKPTDKTNWVNGIRTETTKYDTNGNPSETTKYGPDGTTRSETTNFAADGKTTTKFAANGKTPTEQTKYGPDGTTPTEHTVYENGNPSETTKFAKDGITPSETTKFAADGNTTTKFAADGNTPTEQTKYGPDGTTPTEHTVFENGKPKEQTEYDPAGHKTQNTFWHNDGTSTTLTYDEKGNVTGAADWDKNGNPSDTEQKPGSGALVGNSNTHVGFNKEGQIVQYWDLKNHIMVFLDKDSHWKECGYDEDGRPDYKHSSDLGTKAPVLDPKTGELKAQDKNCREGRPDGVLINGVSAEVQSTRAVVNGAALTVMGTMWLINTYGGFVPVPRAPIEPLPEGPPSQRPPGS